MPIRCPTSVRSSSPAPSPPRPELHVELAASDLPLALLPGPARDPLLPAGRRHSRAAGARLPRQGPHRLARPGAQRRRACVGPALLGAALARRRRRARASARPGGCWPIASSRDAPPGSPARRSRSMPRDGPGQPVDARAAPGRAALPRRRHADDGAAHAAGPAAPGPLDRHGLRRAARWSRSRPGAPRRTPELGRRPRPDGRARRRAPSTTRRPSTTACAG